jgi:serine/threonine protein kinase
MHENAEPTTETQQARIDFAPGHRIDRYELRELIGRGGMGAVYRAVDTKLGRTVALKTVAGRRTGARLTDRVRQRFLREAMALSKVEHRNVVQVMDFGFADDGTPFLVMEYLRGRDLGTLLAESCAPPTVAHVVDIMLGVCAALRACHRVGIVHRDLKPGNIFLVDTDTGAEVKVLDFGVSKAPTSDDLTREGQIVGTPQYLAPEQVDGKVGPASDQYALGVLIYACLTLRLPYEDHQSFGLLRAIETGKFESPRLFRPDLPETLEKIVLRAMHVSPTARFESVYALGQQLWDLASPRGKDEWRSYYFPQLANERRARFAEASKTRILEKPSSVEPAAGGALLYLSTKLAKPTARPPSPAADSTTPVEPNCQPLDTTDQDLRRPRLRLPAAVAGAVLVAALFWVGHGRARHRGISVVRTDARVPRPLPATVNPRAVSAQTPAIATIARLAATVERFEPPAPPEAPVISSFQEPPAPPRKIRAFIRARPAPSARALPNIDHNGIGIPTE